MRLSNRTEIFASEAEGGGKSYLVNLGDLVFSSPTILGGVARRAGISCNTCHVNGAGNPQLYIPGVVDAAWAISIRPVRCSIPKPTMACWIRSDPEPARRGFLAPYGHDGRMASLRDFIRNVIVNEFAGPSPRRRSSMPWSPISRTSIFCPIPASVQARQARSAATTEAERRGEALFAKPFPHDPTLSCAGCHMPSGAFVDHRQHDIGSGGLFKTPTLLNADFNAPYFHDGRFDTFGQVVAHFNRCSISGFHRRISGSRRLSYGDRRWRSALRPEAQPRTSRK